MLIDLLKEYNIVILSKKIYRMKLKGLRSLDDKVYNLPMKIGNMYGHMYHINDIINMELY